MKALLLDLYAEPHKGVPRNMIAKSVANSSNS